MRKYYATEHWLVVVRHDSLLGQLRCPECHWTILDREGEPLFYSHSNYAKRLPQVWSPRDFGRNFGLLWSRESLQRTTRIVTNVDVSGRNRSRILRISVRRGV